MKLYQTMEDPRIKFQKLTAQV